MTHIIPDFTGADLVTEGAVCKDCYAAAEVHQNASGLGRITCKSKNCGAVYYLSASEVANYRKVCPPADRGDPINIMEGVDFSDLEEPELFDEARSSGGYCPICDGQNGTHTMTCPKGEK